MALNPVSTATHTRADQSMTLAISHSSTRARISVALEEPLKSMIPSVSSPEFFFVISKKQQWLHTQATIPQSGPGKDKERPEYPSYDSMKRLFDKKDDTPWMEPSPLPFPQTSCPTHERRADPPSTTLRLARDDIGLAHRNEQGKAAGKRHDDKNDLRDDLVRSQMLSTWNVEDLNKSPSLGRDKALPKMRYVDEAVWVNIDLGLRRMGHKGSIFCLRVYPRGIDMVLDQPPGLEPVELALRASIRQAEEHLVVYVAFANSGDDFSKRRPRQFQNAQNKTNKINKGRDPWKKTLLYTDN
ncbi:uncharacterized protein Z518_02041 [Rhinocladiella mackenziei CBS 650.93]|uniref:Uncharacterized protein n=1 Tax=Rhinocladiella mackenziei CBS 650.93 TaxID=1442369 RepID=A0A0D2HA87_9EURO|nr:uncharacterized protein Z518_02041 [Rhinocladiella mackenziei CBS 650.93]KIX07388.1 hypothetical protein Z518_02041 [Rhinocladiella mackenziei CBS 650.93]